MNRLSVLLSAVIALLMSHFAFAANQAKGQTKPSFEQYVQTLKREAVAKGYDKSMVEQALSGFSYQKKVVKKDKTQPERVQTLDTYLPKRVNDYVVKKARQLYHDNLPLLEKIGNDYGVQPRFIVALWGLESAFGKYTGSHSVFAALTTLSYEGRRESLYRPQIFAALEIVKRGENTVEGLKGSWAGAMGQTQFLPTSYLNYAVDYNGDGKKDIWQSKADVFASIANYLKSEGWDNNGTWGRQVKLPSDFDKTLALSKKRSLSAWRKGYRAAQKSLSQWSELGLLRMDGRALPVKDEVAALVLPDDVKGRAYLAYNNYKTLMSWNRSYYFVTSVGYLSDRIQYPAVE